MPTGRRQEQVGTDAGASSHDDETSAPQAEGVAHVPVPAELLPAVYLFLSDLMAGAPEATRYRNALVHGDGSIESLQRDDPGVLVDPDNGPWTRAMVRLLREEFHQPIAVAALDIIAAIAPRVVSYDDLEQALSAQRNQLRAELASLTRTTRRLFHRRTWPMTARPGLGGGEGMGYRMPSEVADWWRLESGQDRSDTARVTAHMEKRSRSGYRLVLSNDGVSTARDLNVTVLGQPDVLLQEVQPRELAPGSLFAVPVALTMGTPLPLNVVLSWNDVSGHQTRVQDVA